MTLSDNQLKIKALVEQAAQLAGIDPAWACAVAMEESSLGLNQVSHTGARGPFQMTRIALYDLLMKMGDRTPIGDKVGVLIGVAFLALLLDRWGSEEAATKHFCDPNDVMFYWPKVQEYTKGFKDDKK